MIYILITMAKAAQSKQDVHYWRDDKGRNCVHMYAEALNILDGRNPDCWKYDILQECDDYVHHAKLLSHSHLEVKARHSPIDGLTPKTLYNVYYDIKLMHNAKGFKTPTTFEFTDQQGKTSRFSSQLTPGDMKVFVGQFISTSKSKNVIAKMYDFNCQEKSGLVVRRVSIMPPDSVTFGSTSSPNVLSELNNHVPTNEGICMGLVENENVSVKQFACIIKEYKGSIIDFVECTPPRKTDFLEAFTTTSAPNIVTVLPLEQAMNNGCGKNLKDGKEKHIEESQKPKRKCNKCGKYERHDNCNCEKINKGK